jgi:hypothetical protein
MQKLLKLSTWKVIISSRFTYYKNKGKPWYKKRNEICKVCPHNSANVYIETLSDIFWSTLNLKNPFCKVCKCTLKYKTAEPSSVCGLEEINEPPKWTEEWK